jgi:hypothetical protein
MRKGLEITAMRFRRQCIDFTSLMSSFSCTMVRTQRCKVDLGQLWMLSSVIWPMKDLLENKAEKEEILFLLTEDKFDGLALED